MADYNINAVTRKVSYTGSAGVGPYAFSFEILDENDVAVYFNATLLTLTTDYTVTINANGTGSITIVTGTNVPTTPDADDTIIIVGARDIERTTDFVTAGDLRASSLNEQLDSLTIFDQQIDERVERSIKAPAYDPTGINMTLPAKADRASKFLTFDSNGDVSTSALAGLSELVVDNVKIDGNTISSLSGDIEVSPDGSSEVNINSNLNVIGTVEFDGLSGTGSITVTNILDEDNMASDSATALATQQSIKAYVDTTVAATNEVVEDPTPQLGGNLDLNSNNITGTGNIDITGSVTPDSITTPVLTVEPTSDHVILSLRNTATNTFGNSKSFHEIRWEAKDLVGVDITYGEIEGRTVATGSRGKLIFNVKGASGLTDYLILDGDDQDIKALKDVDVTGNILVSGTVDGRDLATDGTKLDGIESGADVTDSVNVTAAGALMDSEVTNLADVKSFDPADYATAAQGTAADSALQDGDTVSSLTITSADINSGNIDNTVIGNSTAASGAFTSLTSDDLTIEPTSDHVILSLRNTSTNTFGSSKSFHEIRWEAKDLAGVDTTYGEIEGRTVASGARGKLVFNVKGASGLTDYLILDGDDQDIKALKSLDVTGNISVSGTVDGRDLVTDGTKLDGIESGADVTDTTNVTAAGALMDSEVANLADVKAFDPADYATSAQGTTADSALQNVSEDTTPQLGGNLDLNSNNVTGSGDIDITGSVTSDGLTIEPTSDHAILSLKNTATNTFGNSKSFHEIRWEAKDLVGVDETYAEVEGRTVASGARGKLVFNIKGASGLTDYLILDGDDQDIKALKSIDVTGTVTADGLTVDTDTLHVDATNNRVGVGTDSPARQLDIYDDGTIGQAVLSITAQNTDPSRLMFADPDDNNIGILDYYHSDDSMRFTVNNSERMRLNSDGSCRWTPDGTNADMTLDASGNLLVGDTSDSWTDTVGARLFGSIGTGIFTRSGANALVVNRLSSDGEIIGLYKDGAIVGSIRTQGGDLVIQSSQVAHCGLRFTDNPDVIPTDNSSSLTNGTVSLGRDIYRFKDLYLSGDLEMSVTTGVGSNAIRMTRTDSGVSADNTIGNWFFEAGEDGTEDVVAQISAVAESNYTSSSSPTYLQFKTTASGNTSAEEAMRIDSSGNLRFNSGYGSVATAYGCRAWVNFDGTGTPAPNGSGNVSSITDNGTGDYTVNFTNAMPDGQYCVSATGINQTTLCPNTFGTTGTRVILRNITGTNLDLDNNSVAIFR